MFGREGRLSETAAGQGVSTAATIEPLTRRNLGDAVGRKLAQMILDGSFARGSKLPSHRELSQRFGVSVATVREAISSLARAGALEVRIGSGTFVRGTGAEPEQAALWFGLPAEDGEMAEFIEARGIIEAGLARLAATRRTPEDCARLEALLGELSRCADDLDAFLEAELAIHLAIAEVARNTPLLRSMLAIRTLLKRNIRFNLAQERNQQSKLWAVLTAKQELVRAIVAGDAGRAEAVVERTFGQAKLRAGSKAGRSPRSAG